MVGGERGTSKDQDRRELLFDQFQEELQNIPKDERKQLCWGRYHNVFSLIEGERGEINLTRFHINTGDAVPKRQPVRRVPFAVRQEVAQQLEQMQQQGIIQP